jgi:DNA-binding transcriptional regulator PaaX
MARNDRTSQLIDAILKYAIVPGAVMGGLVLPGLLIALEKPLDKLMRGVDRRERERELRRTLGYMRSRGLIADNYLYGIKLTKNGRARLRRVNISQLRIQSMPTWDGRWRLIFYDIPEKHKPGRDALTLQLRRLGCYQIQKSIWLHPFPCEDVIVSVCGHYKLEKYVTYTECLSLDNQKTLINYFRKKLPNTKF